MNAFCCHTLTESMKGVSVPVDMQRTARKVNEEERSRDKKTERQILTVRWATNNVRYTDNVIQTHRGTERYTHRKTDRDSGREGKTSKINKHVQEEMSVVSKGSLLFIIDVFLLVRMHHQN